MKGLSVAGTAAMFLVGGGILVHGVAPLRHAIEELADALGPGARAPLLSLLLNGLAGVVAGAVVLGVVMVGQRIARRRAAA